MSGAISMPLPTDPGTDRLAEAVAHAEHDKDRVLLTRDGKPVAAVVPIEDLAALAAADDAEDAHWSRVAEEAVAQWKAEGRPAGVPMEDIARELGVDLTADP